MAEITPGSTFAGHRIEGQLGKGGMGVVYQARDLQLDRVVALKVVAGEYAQDPAFAERFKRESRLAASLDHANVIPIYHAGEEDGRLFVTMRFVEGTDLAAVLKRDRRLAPERAVAILGQVAAALDAAHARGLVHRDVKPANILLQDDHVFLTDFGLSKQAGSGEDLTETGAVLGTVDYMAPEQVQGGIVDGRSDVYALGCVLFQMLTGRVPFERGNGVAKLFAHVSEPPPRVSDVPDALADAVARALEKDPGRRFQSAGELAQAAADAVGVSLAPAAAPLSTRTRRVGRRRRVPLWIPALVATIVGIAVAVAAFSGGGSSSKEKPAVMALLGRLHRGFTTHLCHNDLTPAFRARFFAPRSGQDALNACDNLAGGDPNRKPLVVDKVTIQGDTASARFDVDDEPVTFYLVKQGRRWRADDFTETTAGRYQRQIASAIQPSFRNDRAVDRFVFGELPLEQADGVPAKAVSFLRGAVKQVERLRPPAGRTDIHRRLVAAMRHQLAAAQAALAAQKAGDAKAFRRAGRSEFEAIKALGTALDDLGRSE